MSSLVKKASTLHIRADEVNLKDTKVFKHVQKIIADMQDVLRANTQLVAIAAPQVRHKVRIFCIRFSNSDIRTFINPLITYRKGTHLSREIQYGGSVQEYIVPRSDEINATYQTPTGSIESNKFLGMPGEVFQQMVDLLDGVLLSDYALEVIPGFDEASDEEKQEVITYYLDTLRLKNDALDFQIKADKEAADLNKAIDLLTKIRTGEITTEPIFEEIKEA